MTEFTVCIASAQAENSSSDAMHLCDVANRAFDAHRAILMAEIAQPELRENIFWKILKREAYVNFCKELERVK